MPITNIPPLSAIEGIPFAQTWQWAMPSGDPVDLTGWVGEAVFTRDRVTLLKMPLTLTAHGEVEVALTAAQVGALVGPRVNFQINLALAGLDPSEVWRGNLIVE